MIITLSRKIPRTNARTVYHDTPYTKAQMDQNTRDLAKECSIPVADAFKALMLLYPWAIE